MEDKEFCGISILFDGVRYDINGDKERVREMLEWIAMDTMKVKTKLEYCLGIIKQYNKFL